MAHWGIAIMSMGNPFGWAASPGRDEGRRAGRRRRATGRPKTERERDYIAALAVYFKDWETTEFRPRALAFESAMEAVAAKYPADDEAQIVYALVLNVTSAPSDKTYAKQRKARPSSNRCTASTRTIRRGALPDPHLRLLRPRRERPAVRARLQRNRAVGAARTPHAVAHVLTGRPVEGDGGEQSRVLPGREGGAQGSHDGAGHARCAARDGLPRVRAPAARAGQVGEAGRRRAAAIRKVNVENFVAAYALAAIPSRYALERGDWAAAAELTLSPPDLAWSRFPQSESILVFARGWAKRASGTSRPRARTSSGCRC